MWTAKTYYFLKHGAAFFTAAIALSISCSGDPLLTDLRTNNLEVIIKGTYESDNPKPWGWTSTNINNIISDSITMHPVDAAMPFPPADFMIDIVGMSLSGDSIKTAKFGNYSKTYKCAANDDTESFFSGEGITMKNDDVQTGKKYNYLNLYMRKTLFSDAQRYNLSSVGWEDRINFITYFKEEKVNAFNFNLPLVQYFYDTLRENDSINRIYPLRIKISNDLTFDPREKMVLEIRLVIKNFVKLYEFNYLDYSSDKPYITHYFGVSDWLREVKAGDRSTGGNLLAAARTYVKGKTGTVYGTISGAKYVIGIPAGEDIDDYTMPALGTDKTLRDNKIKHSKIPVLPVEASNSVPAQLLYRMQLEKYKSDWNKFVTDVKSNYSGTVYNTSPQELFEGEWTEYNDAAEKFKIPPLAAYYNTSENKYEIENIAPGTYDFYYSIVDPVWGELFKHGQFTQIAGGMNVAIDAGDNINIQ